jgi:uncharacterized protein YgiM (DUF1202 family)
MRKIIAVLLAAVFMLAVPAAGTAGAAQREFGTVIRDDINMRALPDADAEIVTTVPQGAQVEILEERDDWYRVIYNGLTGYIKNTLVFVSSVSDRIAYAQYDGINLRGGPGESSYIVDTIAAGKPIRVKNIVGDWYFVLYDGQTGFVHKDLITLTKQTGSGSIFLRRGMEGSEVKRAQKELARRGFLSSSGVDGSYGAGTANAVKAFQKAAGLKPADGVAGADTLKMLYDTSNGITKSFANSNDVKGRVIKIDWWKGGNKVLKRSGGTATLIDVKTGKSFKIRRYAGTNHADVTPISASDTATFKSIVGKWTWNRRAVWVIIGSKVYAGSINCMPHAPDHNKSDNFPGHFCLHFVNSRTHGGNRVDEDHQACIEYAYRKGN